MTTENLGKHGFLITPDVGLMHGSNGTFLPGGGGRGDRTICFFDLAPRPGTMYLNFAFAEIFIGLFVSYYGTVVTIANFDWLLGADKG